MMEEQEFPHPDIHFCTVCGEGLEAWNESKIMKHYEDHGKFWQCTLCWEKLPNDADADRRKVRHQEHHLRRTMSKNQIIGHCHFSLVGAND